MTICSAQLHLSVSKQVQQYSTKSELTRSIVKNKFTRFNLQPSMRSYNRLCQQYSLCFEGFNSCEGVKYSALETEQVIMSSLGQEELCNKTVTCSLVGDGVNIVLFIIFNFI
ncbi:Hypothetical_protein [Hexamita inflata]|uniref:Hypothetical_protein n=1 Tax=Hexamita inflata TaxID=28002 RepID=A0AA86UIK0_9EUKA|nr:Hypothetical protein HINF_LOCUS29013 [Hexamita inflata]